jgi:high frequency lysogenization protein
MHTDIRCLAIALAGMFQAIRLVQATAAGTHRDEAACAASIRSIFVTDPETAGSVYADPAALIPGLEAVTAQLGGNAAARDMELARYVVTVLHVERKLGRDRALLDRVRDGIERLRGQSGLPDPANPDVIAGLADCYRQTVSTLQPRIIVKGEQAVLARPEVQQMVRALLLAAVRAAVLWRQCGGGRLTLLLRRRALHGMAGELLASARRGS